MSSNDETKIKDLMGNKDSSNFAKYCDLNYGTRSFWFFLKAELITACFSSCSGAFGYYLRSKFYPLLLGSCGCGVVFGKNITLRHPQKIRLGNNVIIDDNAVIDAKGNSNKGITVGNNVYIGKNTAVYCKNGDITIGNGTNISLNCTLFSNHSVILADDVLVAGYTYIMSGGEYDYNSDIKFTAQDGRSSSSPLTIGRNTWLGASVTVLDGGSIGEHCVIGAHSLVTKPIPSNTLAYGSPAKVVKPLNKFNFI